MTRDDVARRAGVSTAVVSYVMNGGPRPVSAAARARVLKAVTELDYRPNHLARSLRVRRSHALGLIVPDSSNPFFAALARNVEEEARQRGYTLFVGNSGEDSAKEALYVRGFLERRVDGLLLISSGDSSEGLYELQRSHIPMVVVDRLLPSVSAAVIVADNEAGGFQATSHLISHGHERIGCLAGPSNLTPSDERRRGYLGALTEAGLEPERDLVVRSAFELGAGYGATARMLALPNPPTALFASTDTQAMGALRAAADAGLAVPGDLALVSFDGIPESRFTVPSLTTVAQPIRRIARLALDHLMARTQDASAPPTVDVLPVHLVIRGSCGCEDIAPVQKIERRESDHVA